MIAILVGTNRSGSVSAQIGDFVSETYDELSIKNHVLDLAKLPPETFSPNSYVEKPPRVIEFTEQILASAGLYVIVPEYNGSMPGALKLLIDLLPFPESFEGRPVCYLGLAAGQFGGLRPVEHLQQVFGYRNAYNFPHRVFIPAVGTAMGKQGGLGSSDYGDRIRAQAKGFAEFCKALGRL
tara:strand:+ start:1193 stop:1735 length:543 start_codon:yes stop_codon:yes gene_type:complete